MSILQRISHAIEGVLHGRHPAEGGATEGGSTEGGDGVPDEVQPVLAALATVNDPELHLDLVTLGLVRSIEVTDRQATVKMTLTTRGCPVAPAIVEQARKAVQDAGYEAEVELVWVPAWSPDDIRPEGRAKLGRR